MYLSVRSAQNQSCVVNHFSVVRGLIAVLCFLLVSSCSQKDKSATVPDQPAKSVPPKAQPGNEAAPTVAAPVVSQDQPPAPSKEIVLPFKIQRLTGDLDEMAKRRNIRALVLMGPIGFFYDKGQPHGVNYEALQEFQKFVNQKLKTGTLKVVVTFIPVSPNQLEQALTEGLGDLIAYGITITPDREQRVAFSNPIQKDVKQIVITGSKVGAVSSLEDLGGKEIYVNPLTTYYQNLVKLNDSLKKAGKPPIVIKSADTNLSDDDLIQMTNAGLIPATVTTDNRATLWGKVFDGITPHPEFPLTTGGQLAWVVRKNNPQLKQILDEFVEGHKVGTAFGNTILQRYLKNTKWVKNSTSAEELKKFQQNVALFQKYAAEYSFDYLMIAAQGYQESLLDQDRKSPVGAVGIMQVIPKYAAAKPISIPDVATADGNIHAGVKMLRNIQDTYLKDPGLDQLNRTLLAFASYNCGPNRIVRLRNAAKEKGLDPNKWFGNVELLVAQDVGQETVTYVDNIYKYYVAYKLAMEQNQIRKEAKTALKQ
jgi:membrane-bound lytic murein transglycosylase MltF